MEELKAEEGRVSTLSLGEYKIPNTTDIPELVTVLLESPSGPAPYQSKAIGEISNVPLAAAIANAVQDAVGARILDLPITAEKVLVSCIRSSPHYSKVSEKMRNRILARTGETD